MIRFILALLVVIFLTGCVSDPAPARMNTHIGEVLELHEYSRTYTKEITVAWNDLSGTAVVKFKTSSQELYDSLKVGSSVRVYERGGTIEGIRKLGG